MAIVVRRMLLAIRSIAASSTLPAASSDPASFSASARGISRSCPERITFSPSQTDVQSVITSHRKPRRPRSSSLITSSLCPAHSPLTLL